MTLRHMLRFAFALFGAAMMGLAVGALWMVAVLSLRATPAWLALIAAVLLAWAIRHWVRAPGVGAAVLAGGATLLAAIYFNMLMAALRLAGNFDLGLTEAMRTAGVGMLLALARLGIGASDWLWYIVAALLAAWLAWRRRAVPAR